MKAYTAIDIGIFLQLVVDEWMDRYDILKSCSVYVAFGFRKIDTRCTREGRNQ